MAGGGFFGSSYLGAIAGYINPGHLMPLQEVSSRLGLDITADWMVGLAARVIAFLVLLILARILLSQLAGTFTVVNRLPVLGMVNRLSGVVLGTTRGLILILLLVGLLSLLPLAFIAGALSGSVIVDAAEQYLPFLMDNLKSLLISSWERI